MFFGRPWSEWIARYSSSHQSPANRLCHSIGIPLILLSLVLALAIPFAKAFWPVPLGMFLVGWLFQFAGHALEGSRPEFLRDWRFLLVGARWWVAKIRGKA